MLSSSRNAGCYNNRFERLPALVSSAVDPREPGDPHQRHGGTAQGKRGRNSRRHGPGLEHRRVQDRTTERILSHRQHVRYGEFGLGIPSERMNRNKYETFSNLRSPVNLNEFEI